MASAITFVLVCFHLPVAFGRMMTANVREHFRRGTYYDQPMKNIEDVSYAASVDIGGQTMDAVLDSGSFDLEVVSKRCGSSCNGKGKSKYYSREKSITYSAGDLIQLTRYESGDVLAQSGIDKVEIGPLTVSGQAFWEVVYAELPILSYGDFQVILGVGPPGVDQDEIDAVANLADDMTARFRREGFDVPSNFSAQRYRDELPQQKTLLENLGTNSFSVCLERASGADGHFIWNDRSTTEKSSFFREVPVAGKFTWSAKMTGVHLAGSNKHVEACKKACAAIIDSGTSLVMVPTSVYDHIFNHLMSLNADCDRMEELPNLVFDLGGMVFELPPSSYIGLVDEAWSSLERDSDEIGLAHQHSFRRSLNGERQDGKTCNMLLGKIDAKTQIGDMWILGMPFFRAYYVNFKLGENLRDMSARRMTIAAASRGCSPVAGAELDALAPRMTPTYVNWKKLQIPRWAKKAHKRGVMVI